MDPIEEQRERLRAAARKQAAQRIHDAETEAARNAAVSVLHYELHRIANMAYQALAQHAQQQAA